MLLLTVLLMLVLKALPAHPYSLGAPESACASMVPGHGGQTGSLPAPYSLAISKQTYIPFELVQVTIEASPGSSYRGFMLQARDVTTGQLVGGFVPDAGTKVVCGQAITHTNNNRKGSQTFRWRAPVTGVAPVVFRATVVEEYRIYWVGIQSSVLRSQNEPQTTTTTTTAATTTATTSTTASTPTALPTISSFPLSTSSPTSSTLSSDDDNVTLSTPAATTHDQLDTSSPTTRLDYTSGSSVHNPGSDPDRSMTSLPTLQEETTGVGLDLSNLMSNSKDKDNDNGDDDDDDDLDLVLPLGLVGGWACVIVVAYVIRYFRQRFVVDGHADATLA